MNAVLDVQNLNAWFGESQALKNVSMQVERGTVTAVIGPSGCGKSTFVRCLNRLHEEVPGARAEGRVYFEGLNVYSRDADAVGLRRKVGMVFQKPNPFPGLTVAENVAVGLRLGGVRSKALLNEAVEKSLRQAALWDEVKDKLDQPGLSLSGGQQQRLCIARALAVEPEVLLMDEPTSALDPVSAEKVEERVDALRDTVTVVIVTHNLQQAVRIADRTAFFYLGELVEHGETEALLHRPVQPRTQQYVAGRFG